MSSTRNHLRNVSNATKKNPNQIPLSQRRLKTKPILILIAILFVGNLMWLIAWLIPSKETEQGGAEQVAAVDGEVITKQRWMAYMESHYGKETLQTLVNEAVVEKAASKYKIKVSEAEVDMELALMRSAQDQYDTTMQYLTNDQLRQKLRSQLLLEKVLTRDVIVEEKDTKDFYAKNKSLFNIATTYRTNLIVVSSKSEAESVLKELKNGSSFSVLAREHSLDSASASLGGDIGFVSEKEDSIDPAITKTVKGLKAGETSKAIEMSDGRTGIVNVSEVMVGQSFTYEEVKEHIQRELALEQLPRTVTPEVLWSEFNATWFYGESN